MRFDPSYASFNVPFRWDRSNFFRQLLHFISNRNTLLTSNRSKTILWTIYALPSIFNVLPPHIRVCILFVRHILIALFIIRGAKLFVCVCTCCYDSGWSSVVFFSLSLSSRHYIIIVIISFLWALKCWLVWKKKTEFQISFAWSLLYSKSPVLYGLHFDQFECCAHVRV